MSNPRVSFVVPCYKLAHLLAECVHSILAQTYQDFEILIMNDQSPDHTAEVAESFQDPRVRHIYNEKNLGHLRNYNKGILMSRGEYVWLISADDYLRTSDVLRRYVELMDANPRVGYTFCPGVSVRQGIEGSVIGECRRPAGVIPGHAFLKTLLDNNLVLAASVMVRRVCYETISVFPFEAMWAGRPVDMGWLGDWYLWCMFALHYDVGYLPEPMVCYREHDLSMTTNITRRDKIQSCAEADIAMLWLFRQKARDAGHSRVVRDCLTALADEYRRQGASKQYRASAYTMTRVECERSLQRYSQSEREQSVIRARFLEGAGDRARRREKPVAARLCYLASIRQDPFRPKVYAKLLLLLVRRESRSDAQQRSYEGVLEADVLSSEG